MCHAIGPIANEFPVRGPLWRPNQPTDALQSQRTNQLHCAARVDHGGSASCPCRAQPTRTAAGEGGAQQASHDDHARLVISASDLMQGECGLDEIGRAPGREPGREAGLREGVGAGVCWTSADVHRASAGCQQGGWVDMGTLGPPSNSQKTQPNTA